MKKILLTGGSGLLATNWALLQRNHYDVYIGLHDRVVNIKGVNTVKLHLDSVDSFEEDIINLKPDIVVHTVAISNVEFCEVNPDEAYLVNVGIASIVAKICWKYQIKLVHISTDHLFSGIRPLISEEVDVAPVNIYGKTKAEAEVQILCNNPKALVIRTNFYGWGTEYRSSFSDTILQGLRLGKVLDLFNDIHYSPIIISELVQITHSLIDMNESGIFNVCSNERISKYEFGIKLASIFNLGTSNINIGSFMNMKQLVRRPLDMSLSNNKVKSLLSYSIPSISEQLVQLRQQEKNSIANELKKISTN